MRPTTKIVVALAVMCAFAAGMRAHAHHAMVMYDRLRTVTLTGTVVELRWSNPHVFLVVNGKLNEGDQSEVWLLETSGPANLTRIGGWSATVLKPGDRVSVDVNLLREGEQRNARLTKVRLVDTGQELGTAYQDLDLVRPK